MIKHFAEWWNRKRQERRQERIDALLFERKIVVSFDNVRLSAVYPDGTTETIAWPEVQRIAIETNDSGPAGADFWWVFESDTKRCVFPKGATGEPEAVDVVSSRFPGFNDLAVIKAIGSTSNARFVCWERGNAL
jgi:hypothetical protein